MGTVNLVSVMYKQTTFFCLIILLSSALALKISEHEAKQMLSSSSNKQKTGNDIREMEQECVEKRCGMHEFVEIFENWYGRQTRRRQNGQQFNYLYTTCHKKVVQAKLNVPNGVDLRPFCMRGYVDMVYGANATKIYDDFLKQRRRSDYY